MPYVTTPKDHLTARASKGILATDTAVWVNMTGLCFSYCLKQPLLKNSTSQNQFPFGNAQILAVLALPVIF